MDMSHVSFEMRQSSRLSHGLDRDFCPRDGPGTLAGRFNKSEVLSNRCEIPMAGRSDFRRWCYLRTLLCSLLFLASVVAYGCANKSTDSGKTGSAGKSQAKNNGNTPKSKKRIGISVQTMANPFFKLIADVVKKEAEKEGFTVEVRDGAGKIETQNNQVKEFINDGFDAIIICPRNTKSIGQVVREANAADIPVFTIDTKCEDKDAKVVFHVGTDNVQGGHVAGKAMIDALKTKGGGDVAILEFKRVDSCIDRVKGFTAEIEKYNKTAANKIRIVGSYECEGDKAKGQAATRDALNANQQLVGIFAINDPAAEGAIAALETEGKLKDIVVVGFDGQPSAKQAVKDGKMFDTPVQFPRKMAIECVKAVVKYFDADEVQKVMLIPTERYRKAEADKDPALK